ncbi:MAG TPA: hypothetical protein PLQ27_01760 [Candidatus Paceibacterota bacterium]|jgi:uncharacterized HAD superfamily protein|nr:hypothetical protein [Candidatus Paceibacterota bacterium]
MKTGFDLDGVIIKDRLGLTRYWLTGWFCNCYFFYTRLGKFLYQYRPIDKKTYSWLKNRKNRGEKITIISGTNKDHYRLVHSWLNFYRIPYDFIYLKEKENGIAEYKAEILARIDWQFYLEDNYQVAEEIVNILISQYNQPARLRKWKRGRQILYLILIKNNRKNNNGSKF